MVLKYFHINEPKPDTSPKVVLQSVIRFLIDEIMVNINPLYYKSPFSWGHTMTTAEKTLIFLCNVSLTWAVNTQSLCRGRKSNECNLSCMRQWFSTFFTDAAFGAPNFLWKCQVPHLTTACSQIRKVGEMKETWLTTAMLKKKQNTEMSFQPTKRKICIMPATTDFQTE